MKKVSLSTLRIPSNYVLIKPDPDYESVLIEPESEFSVIDKPVELQVGYTSETHARHYSITGIVVAVPEKLTFNKDRIAKLKKGRTVDLSLQIEISKLMNASLEIDTDVEIQPGDKVWYSYLCQINAVEYKLKIDTEEHGMCFLVKYEDLYCYERDGNVELINGWVWIKQIEKNNETESGLQVQYNEKNQYESNKAIVVKAGKAIRRYMDCAGEDQIDLKGGEQIIYNGSFGFPMEYSIHRKLTDGEVLSIRRKHIYAVV